MIKNEPNHRSNETLIEGFKTTKINSSTKGPACRLPVGRQGRQE